ncbi:MAG: class I SAM-dependent methyltransferase [Actinomycetota bacterium]|nr:class I SAM-dependent methyltransferase [Actinomycetota bacterium]
MTATQRGSASIEQPTYWWYRARADLLHAALGSYLGTPHRVLDVGSADGPSVDWMRGTHDRFAVDVDPRGLVAGEGVRASAIALPFADETFDVVAAFDVLEHCEPEQTAMAELVRVLRPGGRLLMSVPAYEWAWTDHDVQAGHHRRYTRPRLVTAVERGGLDVLRATYGFGAVFPFFVAERALRRVRDRTGGAQRQLTSVSARVERLLLGLAGVDRRVLGNHDLPFGSSVFLAAVKP